MTSADKSDRGVDRDDSEASCADRREADDMRVDRRQVLAGAGALAAAGASSAIAAEQAPETGLRFVRDLRRHDRIGILLDGGGAPAGSRPLAIFPDRFLLSEKDRPAGEWEEKPTAKAGARRLLGFSLNGMRFSAERAAAPPTERYGLRFVTVRDANASLLLQAWFQTSSGAIAARKALKVARPEGQDDKAPETVETGAFEFPLAAAAARQLLQNVFGDRIELVGARPVTLKMRLLAASARQADDGRAAQRPPPWIELEPEWRIEAAEGTQLLVMQGAVALGGLTIRRIGDDQGEGVQIQVEQQRARGEKACGPTGCETRLTLNKVWYGDGEAPQWRAAGPGGRAGRVIGDQTKTDQPHVVVESIGINPTLFALRQWGDPKQTLAVLRGPMIAAVSLHSQAGKPTKLRSVFRLAEAILTHQVRALQPAASAFNETLTGRLDDKEFDLETAYGRLTICGDPSPAGLEQRKEGNKSAAIHPLGLPLDRVEEFAGKPAKGLTQLRLRAVRNAIAEFDVRALLKQVSLTVPERRTRPSGPAPSNTSPSGRSPSDGAPDENARNETAIIEGGLERADIRTVWSRLDFRGTEIAFRLPLAVPGGQTAWPSARGVVTLFKQPARLPDPSLMRDGERVGVEIADFSVALDGALLKIRRDYDNLALSFGFDRLALELGSNGGQIVPNARLSGGGRGAAAAGARQFDDRPRLIVHFPPQHVAEKAYYRLINDGVALPEAPGQVLADQREGFNAALEGWRAATDPAARNRLRLERLKIEEALLVQRAADLAKANASPEDLRAIWKLSRDGSADGWLAEASPPGAPLSAALAGLRDRWNALPLDQRSSYLGPSALALDPDARRVWGDIWRAVRKETIRRGIAAPSSENEAVLTSHARARILQLPGADLPDHVRKDLIRRAGGAPDKPLTAELQERLRPFFLDEKKKREPDLAAFIALYHQVRTIEEHREHLPDPYLGRDTLLDALSRVKGNKLAALVKAVDLLADRHGLTAATDGSAQDPFLEVTPARLSGPSRLVFRIDPAGGALDLQRREDSSRLTEDLARVRAIELSVEGLTDWGRFDLAVAARAETLEIQPGERVPHLARRAVNRDAASGLRFQGIAPGQTIEGRLQDIARSLKPPAADETAIELPFRLQLSPDQFGRFRTRRPIAAAVFGLEKAAPKDLLGPTVPPLWTTHLQVTAARPVVRALWSDDFRPAALTAGAPTPERGPKAPWSEEGTFRAALDAYDRHELVALSSVYGLPTLGRRNELGGLTDPSQIEPPPGYRLKGLKDYKIGERPPADYAAIYQPKGLDMAELRLSALGGSLRHDTHFTPPAAAVREDGRNLFDALSIERWRQVTVLGRDIEVEVVYKGFLFPLGVRAALVKLTERQFFPGPDGSFRAYLIQRQYIRIGDPDKYFRAAGQPDGARRFPVKLLRMLTTQTPDILDPNEDKLSKDGVSPNGAITLTKGERPLPGLCFWPRTQQGGMGDIPFAYTLDGKDQALRMPLVFVDNTAAHDPGTVAALAAYYNDSAQTSLRTVNFADATHRYADERNDGECTFRTLSWDIQAEGRAGGAGAGNSDFTFDPLLEGADQPPFYPFMAQAWIRIDQAERFIARALGPQPVAFDEGYRSAGFPAEDKALADTESERYLRLATDKPLPLDMGQSGDRSGGLGRPALAVRYLSRRYGLLPDGDLKAPEKTTPAQTDAQGDNASEGGPRGTLVPLAPPTPGLDLANFFSDDAKLLGLIKFKDLIATLQKLSGNAAPELKEKLDSATEESASFLRQKVIPPLEHALASLAEAWDAAQRKVEDGGAAAGLGRLELDRIYPDIKPSLHGLIVSVAAAKAASSLPQIISAMSQVQSAGRRLVTALNRAIADPVTPLRDEMRKQLGGFSSLLTLLGDGLLGELRRQQVDLIKAVARLARDAMSPALARAIIRLPTPAAEWTSGGAPEAELRTALDEAGRVAVSAFVSGIASGKSDRGALHDALIAAEASLNATTGLSEQVRRRANAYAAEARKVAEMVSNLAANAGDDVLREVRGPLFDKVTGDEKVVARARALAATLGSLVRDPTDNPFERLARPLGDLLTATAEAALGSIGRETCVARVDEAAALLVGLIPPPGNLNRLRALAGRLRAVPALSGAHADLDALIRATTELINVLGVVPTATPSLGARICGLSDSQSDLRLDAVIARLGAAGGRVLDTLGAACEQLHQRIPPEQRDAVFTDFGQDARALLSLATGAAREQLDAVATRIDTLVVALDAPAAGAIPEAIKAALKADLPKARDKLRAASLALRALPTTAPDSAAFIASLQLVAGIIKGVAPNDQMLQNIAQNQRDAVRAALKDGLSMLLAEAGAAISRTADVLTGAEAALRAELTTFLRNVLRPGFQLLGTFYGQMVSTRAIAQAALTKDDGDRLLQRLKSFLRSADGQPLSAILVVGAANANNRDQLDQEADLITRLAGAEPLNDKDLEALEQFARDWREGRAAPLVLARRLGDILRAVAKGEFSQFVDLNQIRREVDEAVRMMVPARISQSYDLKLKLMDLGRLLQFEGKTTNAKLVGLPEQHSRGLAGHLLVRARGSVDLIKPERSTFTAEAFMPAFALQLLPSFDVVTIGFAPAMLTAGPGQPFNVHIKVRGVELGNKVQFLKKLQNLMPPPPGGRGFYLRVMTGRSFGIEAGYMLPVGPITIGNMFIDDLSLNVSAELPFDTRDARFKLQISRPEVPFTIAVAPYAGAGHFGLIANPRGIVGFEASFQFGGGGGFAFGPLLVKGRLGAGIFVRQIEGHTELYGTFYCGGSAKIACFNFGAELYVRLAQEGGNLSGLAYFTFSFVLYLHNVEFTITVFRKQPGSGSGGGKSEPQPASGTRGPVIDLLPKDYAVLSGQPVKPAFLQNRTSCKGENFGRYMSYFRQGQPLLGAAPRREDGPARTSQRAPRTQASPSREIPPSIWMLT
jgi:hypothetical protein